MKCGRIHFGPMNEVPAQGTRGTFIVCNNCRNKVSPEANVVYLRTGLTVKRIIVAAHQANLDNLKRGAK